uniref:Uncharacterized protein n=1 Tax=Arundo donax TaxID=35708 RepID=A0A0A9HCH1_ARUDO
MPPPSPAVVDARRLHRELSCTAAVSAAFRFLLGRRCLRPPPPSLPSSHCWLVVAVVVTATGASVSLPEKTGGASTRPPLSTAAAFVNAAGTEVTVTAAVAGVRS